MKLTTLVIICLTIGTNFVFSQTYTYSDTDHVFVVTVDTVWNEAHDDYTGFTVRDIQIFDKSTQKLLQTIIPEETFLMGGFDDDLFHIEDVNFDGLNDFMLLADCPAYVVNRSFLFYVFNPAKKYFVPDTVLNNVWLTSPNFDRTDHTIQTFSTDGSEEYGSLTYQYANDSIWLVASEGTSIYDGGSTKSWTERINGVMTEVRRVEIQELEDKPGWVMYSWYEIIKGELKATKTKKMKGDKYLITQE